jgi:hypothetical protein
MATPPCLPSQRLTTSHDELPRSPLQDGKGATTATDVSGGIRGMGQGRASRVREGALRSRSGGDISVPRGTRFSSMLSHSHITYNYYSSSPPLTEVGYYLEGTKTNLISLCKRRTLDTCRASLYFSARTPVFTAPMFFHESLSQNYCKPHFRHSL